MIYLTSDWHFNEHRITPEFNPFFRPFKSVEEQNKTIISNINSVVKEDDELYHLGDLSIDVDGIELMDQITCKNRTLILGNYDVDIPEKMPLLMRAFNNKVFNHLDLNLQDGTAIHLNHYPSNAVDGKLNIVGHIHGLWRVQPNMINVGVDAWHFLPVSMNEILFTKNAIENHYDENVFPKR